MINKMKQKNIFFLFILYCLSKNSLQQQLIIPIEPGLDVEHNENNNNDNEKEGDQPIIITKEITRNDGQHIKITKIHFHKTKNLNGDSDAITPFQIIRIFDNRVNSIFEDIIRQTLGFRSIFNMVENADDDDDSGDDTEDTKQKKINKRRNKKYNKKNGVDDIFDEIEKQFDLIEENENKNKTNYKEENANKENNESDNKKNEVSKETKSKNGNKSNEKSKENLDMAKSAKKKKKLSRKQLIFSRVCKYIFYMIILFGFYWLIKKFLEFLEIIDPDGVTEAKIQDEETTNLKKIENK
jgi:hypothetical protein